jgi:hypothetical protein
VDLLVIGKAEVGQQVSISDVLRNGAVERSVEEVKNVQQIVAFKTWKGAG